MEEVVSTGSGNRIKFIMGGMLIVVAIVLLVASSTLANRQESLTVDDITAEAVRHTGKPVKLTGAVVGDSISYDPQTLTLRFSVAHVTDDTDEIEAQGGLAQVLYDAVTDPSRTRLEVVYIGPKPDLLRNEAEAIMTGKLGEDGVFYAEELLLKCPTKYEEAVPEQTEG